MDTRDNVKENRAVFLRACWRSSLLWSQRNPNDRLCCVGAHTNAQNALDVNYEGKVSTGSSELHGRRVGTTTDLGCSCSN